jgi:hypothetical protein
LQRLRRDGIRNSIRTLGTTNELRALKAEDLADDQIMRKLGKECLSRDQLLM